MSNFDIVNLQNIAANDQKGLGCNQVLYNLAQHEVEWAARPGAGNTVCW